ncbi:MAG: hypothetical protein ACI4EE_10505 [Lachnospiraceae bacterium]
MKSLKDQINKISEKQNDLEIQMAEIQLQQELTNCKLELAEMTSETQ